MEIIWIFIGIVVFAILFGGEGPKKPGKYDHIQHDSPNANDRMGGAS